MKGALHKRLFFVVGVLVYAFPAAVALIHIVLGDLPFWYDNARDMLLAWDNLQKPTLIGPTTGIPGVFYGPYWIWLLSVPLAFTKDPRYVYIFVGLLPYCILLPFLLRMYFHFYSASARMVLWILFITSAGMGYMLNVWNPHIAPLLLVALIGVLVHVYPTELRKGKGKEAAYLVVSGLCAALITHTHMSLGIGISLGVWVYLGVLSVHYLYQHRYKHKALSTYQAGVRLLTMWSLHLAGYIVVFVPSLIFEIRHGFNQTKTLLGTLSQFGDVVAVKGMTKIEVVQAGFHKFAFLLHISDAVGIIIASIAVIAAIVVVKKGNMQASVHEKRLLILLLVLGGTLCALYLSARNPVWEYHFIGVEILFLLGIGLLMNTVRSIRIGMYMWAAVLLLMLAWQTIEKMPLNPMATSSLALKEYQTDIIADDAGEGKYTVLTYSPAVYGYPYTYLFRWRHAKDVPFDPGAIQEGSEVVYVVIPSPVDAAGRSFLSYRTPDSDYSTMRDWELEDGSLIVKRVRSNPQLSE